MKYFKCKVEEGYSPIEEEISRKEYLAAYNKKLDMCVYDESIKNFTYYYIENHKTIDVDNIFFTL